jgi:predicted TIM-barrel fold metal-dependent hydrolase
MPVWSGLTGVVESARLVRAGMTTRVAVIAGPKDPAEIEMIRAGIGYEDDADRLIGLLRKLGVSEAMRVDETAAGTEAEARVLADWSNRHGFVTMIVVSTPDHSRRLRRVLRRSMHGHRTRVMVRAATAATFDPDRWWESRDGVRIGVLELEKLVFDIIRHPWS